MVHGARPYRIKRKDRDYIKSFHPEIAFGTAAYPQFPAEFLTDKTGWLPDQNADGLPYACTSYATTKAARILGVVTATVDAIERLTNSNAKGGYGVVESIDVARKSLGWFKWRYIIQKTGSLDYFGAHQLAQVSGLPEQRPIPIGTPWPATWENAVLAGAKILPPLTAADIAQIHANPNSVGWHDWLWDGWSQNFPVAPGKLLARLDSWQGEKDYLYIDQAVFNQVMDLFGTVSVIPTNTDVLPAKVSLPDWFWSLWHSWLGYSY